MVLSVPVDASLPFPVLASQLFCQSITHPPHSVEIYLLHEVFPNPQLKKFHLPQNFYSNISVVLRTLGIFFHDGCSCACPTRLPAWRLCTSSSSLPLHLWHQAHSTVEENVLFPQGLSFHISNMNITQPYSQEYQKD